MTGRENVVKHIDTLKDILLGDDDSPTLQVREALNVLADVQEMLNTQKPVEPYVRGRGTGFESASSWWYACGNCHKPIDVIDKFCRHCGRPLNWLPHKKEE